MVFKLECALQSHESFFKTQIPGLHTSRLADHILFGHTERQNEQFWCKTFWVSANSRDQEKDLEGDRNGKKQNSLHFVKDIA